MPFVALKTFYGFKTTQRDAAKFYFSASCSCTCYTIQQTLVFVGKPVYTIAAPLEETYLAVVRGLIH